MEISINARKGNENHAGLQVLKTPLRHNGIHKHYKKGNVVLYGASYECLACF